MTRLAIVSYPRLAEADDRRVESIRKQHDPQASLLRAHFTLVFPADVAEPPVVAHASRVVAAAQEIRIVLRRAQAVRDGLHEGGGHVFLVPDEGRAEIIALHDQLYDGVLQAHLRSDVPFVPHITVAAHAVYERCVALALKLNADPPLICGTVDGIELVEVSAGDVRSLVSLPFGGADPTPEREARGGGA